MTDVNESLREFDAVEANLTRLESLWRRMESVIPEGIEYIAHTSGGLQYQADALAFRRILAVMPAIEGFRLEDSILSLDDIADFRREAWELGLPEMDASVAKSIRQQAAALCEYRSRFDHRRRNFARSLLVPALTKVEQLLNELAQVPRDERGRTVEHNAWDSLIQSVDQIDVLLGRSMDRGRRWGDLRRHLACGLWQDCDDIAHLDWPNVKQAIETSMYSGSDPIPVSVTDLSSIATEVTTGVVKTGLKWDTLTAEGFEAVVYELILGAKSYENTNWPMKTHAPDRGRDIETWRVAVDQLLGTSRFRVIVQCKHWHRKGSIGPSDVSTLKDLVLAWEPPRVDELIIATSGHFSQDALQMIERHNEEKKPPRAYPWAVSHLEHLLARRPDIVARFQLR